MGVADGTQLVIYLMYEVPCIITSSQFYIHLGVLWELLESVAYITIVENITY